MNKYQVIYADPPWQYSSRSHQDSGRGFSELKPYKTMTINQIKALPIKDICCDDAALFLWVTDSHLKQGIEVIESWGFKYKTIGFVWLKIYMSARTCVNFAPWTLKSTEICLLGIKGKMGQHKTSNKVYQLIEAVREGHSKKPNEARRRIEKLFANSPKIELFAREKKPGWDVWGNEVESDIKLF